MASHVHPADPAGGQWALALFLLTLLESDGRDGRDRRDSPDVVIYSSVISACEKGRQWQRALQVLWRMEVLQIRPNHGGVFVGRFSEGACSAMQKKTMSLLTCFNETRSRMEIMRGGYIP